MQKSKIKINEIKRLKNIITEQAKEIQRLQSLSDRDFLTGIYNRPSFVREAEKFLKEFKIKTENFKKRRFCISNFFLIFVDLDNLKKINDLYGHRAGDEFIKKSAEIFKNHLREFDIIGRWGGDEFIIGIINLSEQKVYQIAKRLKNKISQIKISKVNKKIKLSASFGVISAKNNHKPIFNLYELIEKADMAMYEAKKNQNKDFIISYQKLQFSKFD